MLHGSDSMIFGPVKVKDGLFVGDEYASQDLEFLVTNKVTHIINTAGKQISNNWESVGVSYLTLNWLETDNQVLFDAKDEIINELFKFIENGLNRGESVLVHSLRGINRCCCVLAVYFMKKFKWTLFKTLEFLHSKKPNIEIRPAFYNQLTSIEAKLIKQGIGPKTSTWNELTDEKTNLDSEELLLTNTYINSQKLPLADYSGNLKKDRKPKIEWADHKTHGSEGKGRLSTIIGKNAPINNSKRKSFKSVLKGSKKVFSTDGTDPEKESTQNPNVNMPNSDPKIPTIRPSSMSNSHRPFIIRENSLKLDQSIKSQPDNAVETSKKEKEVPNVKSPNNQNNIIHITVNNYITNNNINHIEGTKIQVGPKTTTTKETEDGKDDKKNSFSQPSEIEIETKKGDIPTIIIKNNKKDGSTSKNKILIKRPVSIQGPRERERESLEDIDNPGLHQKTVKSNNFMDIKTDSAFEQFNFNPTLQIIGNQSFKNQNLRAYPQTSTNIPVVQIPKVKSAPGLSRKNMHSSSVAEMMASFVPIKTPGARPGQEFQAFNNIELKQNPVAPTQKLIIKRPPTAPENPTNNNLGGGMNQFGPISNTVTHKSLKKFMMDSPYYSATSPTNTGSFRTPKAPSMNGLSVSNVDSGPAIRESSLQPSSAGDPGSNGSGRNRPATTGSFINFKFFQENANKPKWKY